MAARDEERLERALVSLDGLSVGDGFGERFFGPPGEFEHRITTRALPNAPWRWTDDTNMALSIVSVLRRFDEIEQDSLALSYAHRFDRTRGYGLGMFRLMHQIRFGAQWRRVAPALFDGQGSFGNGAAMRVAPLGAYFADDLEAVVEHARRSAEVTHTHAEAVAGAIAVAMGAALACRARTDGRRPLRQDLIEGLLPFVPVSTVRARLEAARDTPSDASLGMVVERLGNGSRISAQDTVGYVLWCAGEYLEDYEEALWRTVSGGGDLDTTCAMVGGIVACYTGREGIPSGWLEAREPLPRWPFEEESP